MLRMIVKSGKMDGDMPAGSLNTPEHQALARELAEDSITLLKNDRNVLPLKGVQVHRRDRPERGGMSHRRRRQLVPGAALSRQPAGRAEGASSATRLSSTTSRAATTLSNCPPSSPITWAKGCCASSSTPPTSPARRLPRASNPTSKTGASGCRRVWMAKNSRRAGPAH